MKIFAKLIAVTTFDNAFRGQRHQCRRTNPLEFRDYAALAGLVLGGILASAGIISLTFSAQLGLAGLFFGTAAIGTGISTLAAGQNTERRD